MNKGYKYKLYPTKEQKILLKNHMFNSSQAYNIILSLKQKERENNKKRKSQGLEPEYNSSTYIDNQVKDILKNRNLKINTKVLQQERIRFNQNYQSQIKKIKNGTAVGDLKYKTYSHNSSQSFQTTKEQYNLIDFNNKYKILRLFNQSIKIKWSRDLPKDYTSITISFDGNNYFIVFNVKEEDKKDIKGLTIKDKPITKDLKNYQKTKKKILKLKKKIINKRNHRIHEITNNLIKFILTNGFNKVVVEKLDVKNMTTKTTGKNYNKVLGKKKTKSMKKNILDISPSLFFNIFKYKCVQSGIVFDEIDPKDTTKTCSSCGNIQEIDLTIREYICPVCNMVKDRDWNSCINIQNKSKVRN